MAQILFISAGGGGGGATPDRFAPKYLVGNTSNGDTASVAGLAAGFSYIPDPGDGTGIALAIAAATALPGDIWIRPGTYDLTQPTSPIAPFSVPNSVVVRGTGNTTVIRGRLSGDQRVFTLASSSELRDIRINCIGVQDGTGDALVECSGGVASPSRLERVDFQLTRLAGSTGTIRAAVATTLGSAELTNCRFLLSGNIGETAVGGLCAVFGDSGSFTHSFRCIVRASTPPYDCGFVASGAARFEVSECNVTLADFAAVHMEAGSLLLVSDSTLSTDVGGDAIYSSGSRGVISCNEINGNVDTSGGSNHILTSNLIRSTATVTLSASDEDAHNITF